VKAGIDDLGFLIADLKKTPITNPQSKMSPHTAGIAVEVLK
jgi:hypothetical protein